MNKYLSPSLIKPRARLKMTTLSLLGLFRQLFVGRRPIKPLASRSSFRLNLSKNPRRKEAVLIFRRALSIATVAMSLTTSAFAAKQNEEIFKTIGKATAPQTGTFNYALQDEPSTLNPITYTDLYSRYVLEYVVSYLMVRNQNTWKYEPSVADKVDISKDGLEFTFTINKDAKWSDGKPLTAEDVKFSYDAIRDPAYNAADKWPYYENLKSVEVIDPRHVKMVMKEKYFKNQEVLCDAFILPKHIYGDAKEGIKKNKSVIGSGPYKIAQYDQGKRIVLEKVENWWGNSVPNFKGRYNFKNVNFRFIKDPTIQIEALKKGEIDYIDDMTDETYVKRAVGPEWGKKVEKYKVVNKAPKSYGFIAWNLKRDLFKDRDVRIALAMLVNRAEMNEKFKFNMAVPAAGPFYNQSPNADPAVKPFAFDPKKAGELLKKAGWTDSDKSGTLSKMIDGKKVEFKFTLLYSNKDTEKYWTLYKEDLKKAGIQMELKLIEWNALVKASDDRNFDAFTMRWGGVVEEDPKQIWHSSSDVKGGSNYGGYKNPEVDAAIEKARVEMDDQKRSILMRKVYRLIAEDAPYAFLFNEKFMCYAISDKVATTKDTFVYDVGMSYWFARNSAQ